MRSSSTLPDPSALALHIADVLRAALEKWSRLPPSNRIVGEDISPGQHSELPDKPMTLGACGCKDDSNQLQESPGATDGKVDTVVLLVHGVGPFATSERLADVQWILASEGLAGSVAVDACDWRSQVPPIFDDQRVHLDSLPLLAVALRRMVALAPGRDTVASTATAALLFLVMSLWPALLVSSLLLKGLRSLLPYYLLLSSVVLAIGIVAALYRQRLRAWAALREILLPIVWPWLHALAVPQLLLDQGILLVASALFFAALGLEGVLLGKLLMSGPPWVIRLLTSEGSDGYLSGTGLAVIVLAFLYMTLLVVVLVPLQLTVNLLLRPLRRPVGSLILVASDVARYVGDSCYRRTLLAAFSSKLDEATARARRQVVIAAHSLGSVIAVDHLRMRRPTGADGPRLILLTMGSPLRRMFERFFPPYYGPPDRFRELLRRRHPALRWINVHRPRDPIGARLFGPGDSDDVCTEKSLAWTRAHNDYWSDREVLRRLLSALASEEPSLGPETVKLVDPPAIPSDDRPASQLAESRILIASPLGIIGMLPPFLALGLALFGDQSLDAVPAASLKLIVLSMVLGGLYVHSIYILGFPYFASLFGFESSALESSVASPTVTTDIATPITPSEGEETHGPASR